MGKWIFLIRGFFAIIHLRWREDSKEMARESGFAQAKREYVETKGRIKPLNWGETRIQSISFMKQRNNFDQSNS